MKKKLVNFINEEKTIFKPQNIVRPVQRAWNQDDTMDFYEEADALPPGGIRFVCVHARVLLHPCIMYACILSVQCLGMSLFSQHWNISDSSPSPSCTASNHPTHP